MKRKSLGWDRNEYLAASLQIVWISNPVGILNVPDSRAMFLGNAAKGVSWHDLISDPFFGEIIGEYMGSLDCRLTRRGQRRLKLR